MAHIDAGKTTVSERILYYTGRTYKMGEVHEGTAVMDYLEEEQRRGITITSAATKCPWKGFEINLIDTPGHIDFTAEVERSLRVLDGAIAVFDASEGVQAQSETVWRQGQKYGLPCLCFINKMDKTGADFEMSVQSIHDKLLASPVCVEIPIGAEDSFAGIIDVITMRAVFYETETMGAKFHEADIPSELMEKAQNYRAKMIELVAEYDDELMDAFIHDRTPSEQSIRRAIRRGTLENRVNPLFVGSALKYVGIQRLLDGVVGYFPSPLDKPALVAHKVDDKSKEISVTCDPGASLVALAFKIIGDAHGDLYFLRIYQGTLKTGSRVLNSSRDKRENIMRVFEMHANERKILESARAGEIVAVIGPRSTLTGDTLCDPKKPMVLPSITFPQTVITMSIEPRTAAERTKLTDALEALRREDPTFGYRTDKETGQTIISGMGELHLEILQHKLVREKKVDVRVGKPRVAYKETITQIARAEGRFVHQSGGRGQYGHAILEVGPLVAPDGHWESRIDFVDEAPPAEVPHEYVGAVERGVREATGNGVLAGYPVIGVRARLVGGSHHSVDSSELAYEQAGAFAFEKALKQAGPVLLEPVMRVQAVVPDSAFGAVQADLLSRRGLITDCRVHGNMRVVDAKVPLVELFGYSSDIRSLTAGRGTFTMEPLAYERVPDQVAKDVIL
ncbi:MAG: elongation factor G [Sedimentisphaerales bacterium]|nr:elongation factor G [Sedimentisphaerales bacterium]